MQKIKLWLVGAGNMAEEYAKVLAQFNVSVVVIGRGLDSAKAFAKKTGHVVHTGGTDEFLGALPDLPDVAIIATGVEALSSSARALLEYGVKKILVEKPASLNLDELRVLVKMARERGAKVYVGYNRRMYASVIAAKKIIQEDGGVLSMNFEFTEWSSVIRGLEKAKGIKEAWLLCNSTHVIDLAFYLGGRPVALNADVAGSGVLSWHPSSSIFTGSGVTSFGALFSYQANWTSPGRWGLELTTANHRLIFRPLETLQIINQNSVESFLVDIDDSLDQKFKPGLYRQLKAVIFGDDEENLCTLDNQVLNWPIYSRMANYN